MDIELYNSLMEHSPKQDPTEWKMFLDFCERSLQECEIENPIVVEVGTHMNRQRPFWEQIFKAEHIGIDISDKMSSPDILGDSNDLVTLEALKNRLNGKAVNILFIDASHCYENVKKDFELYGPLCSDIIALHDIELGRFQDNKSKEVWKFWDKIKLEAPQGIGGHQQLMFLSIFRYWSKFPRGIGVILKNGYYN